MILAGLLAKALTAPAPVAAQGHEEAWIARGEAPDWRIVRAGERWLLLVAGEPPRPIVPNVWKEHPRGRHMVATMAGTSVTLVTTYGLCRTADDKESSHFVAVRLSNSRTLNGCMNANDGR